MQKVEQGVGVSPDHNAPIVVHPPRPEYEKVETERSMPQHPVRMTRRPFRWTPEEDERLTALVDKYGKWRNMWYVIAGEMDGRAERQCKERWLYHLQPDTKKDEWTGEEDAILIEAHKELGNKWSRIADKLPGRTGRHCRERWMNYLFPGIKKEGFTEPEDQKIIMLHKEMGNKWSSIAKQLEGRTDNAVKNRWNTVMRQVTRYIQAEKKGKSFVSRHANSSLFQYCLNLVRDDPSLMVSVPPPHKAKQKKSLSHQPQTSDHAPSIIVAPPGPASTITIVHPLVLHHHHPGHPMHQQGQKRKDMSQMHHPGLQHMNHDPSHQHMEQDHMQQHQHQQHQHQPQHPQHQEHEEEEHKRKKHRPTVAPPADEDQNEFDGHGHEPHQQHNPHHGDEHGEHPGHEHHEHPHDADEHDHNHGTLLD